MSGQKWLRVFHASLASDLRKEYRRNECPCCGRAMFHGKPRRKGDETRRDRATVAHDIATGYGGNPAVWVWACLQCNADQADVPFWNWGKVLERRGDPRADRVLRLAGLVLDWCAANKVERKLGRKG